MHLTGNRIPRGIAGSVRNQTEKDQQPNSEKLESRGDLIETFWTVCDQLHPAGWRRASESAGS